MDAELQSLIEQVPQPFMERLDVLHLPPQDYQEAVDMIQQFNGIAAGMLQDGTGIELAGSPQPIPIDERMVIQGLKLFAEALYYTLVRCYELGLPPEVKQDIVQNRMAIELFGQAKNLLASTYGQEHTPDLQISFETQVGMMQENAKNYLMYFLEEYEKENGPIDRLEPPPPLPTTPTAATAPATPLSPPTRQQGEPPPAPLPTAAALSPPLPGHEKYGAVALLLTTLPPEQRVRILKSFSTEEKELITFYSYPQHLEDNLDMRAVERHLQAFKERFKKRRPDARSEAWEGIARLVASNSRQELLSWVKDERPAVKNYLALHLTPDDDGLPRHRLPARLEDILFQFLAKRLAPA